MVSIPNQIASTDTKWTLPYGRVYFVLMHETDYLELSGTHHFLENSADHHCIVILHQQDTVVIQTQAKSTENSKLHMPLFGEFGRSSRDSCHYGGYNEMNPGTIGWIRALLMNFQFSNGSKIARMAPISTIFGRNRSRRLKLFFSKFSRARKFSRRQKFSRRRKILATSKQTKKRTAKKFSAGLPVDEI